MSKLKTAPIKRQWKVLLATDHLSLQEQLNSQRDMGFGPLYITETANTYTVVYFPMRTE